MALKATARVHNPANVGAIAEAGIFKISYRGQEIGSAATKQTNVAPSSYTMVTARVEVDNVPTQAGMMMLQDIVNNHTQLPVQVDGSLIAVAGPFRVHCKVHCDLLTDVSALPTARFTQKDCQYTYSV
uniref:Late embryogenesis abundant protein LEA-2 subgroup domain-containing protein n=1 Tax=Spumella elongata TaxID=89044 RepID=A0A7S3GNL5_9STRA|mmetsp:Transcript_11502/g.20293  ORF Transcript_11502/g.20293 Transcript_11502/m.20293 type:complete len:128 (+) Transcript_11502:1-384(+)